MEANPDKISVISNMGPPRNLKDIQLVTGCFFSAFICFISRLGEKTMTLYMLLKKSDHLACTQEV